jgi:hypothetical protein
VVIDASTQGDVPALLVMETDALAKAAPVAAMPFICGLLKLAAGALSLPLPPHAVITIDAHRTPSSLIDIFNPP